MLKEIAGRRVEIAEICRRFGARRLEVFGSAARGSDFDPARSDVDILVEFHRETGAPNLERFFALQRELEAVVFANVVAFRNRLIHGYSAVIADTVWRTAQEDLPVLKQRVAALLSELGENP